jgi:hypothetical protein
VFTSVPGGKPQLLREARDRALAGDDEPVPVPQRSWFVHAMSQTDPTTLLRLQAGNYRRISDRAAVLEGVLASAAATDPSLAELQIDARNQRHRGARLVAERLAELHALPNRMTIDRATDSIYALASPDIYRLLVIDRGWRPDDYESWLSDRLVETLLTAR